MLIGSSGVEFAFRVWKEHGRDEHRIVGFSGRLHERKRDGKYKYLFRQRSYSMILTNAAFLDMTMLDWFWHSDRKQTEARRHVDAIMNCEDILMNCKSASCSTAVPADDCATTDVVTSHTKLPPILVHAPGAVRVLESSGISSQKNHDLKRSKCLTKFSRLYGNILQETDVAMRDGPVEAHRLIEPDWQYQERGQAWDTERVFQSA